MARKRTKIVSMSILIAVARGSVAISANQEEPNEDKEHEREGRRHRAEASELNDAIGRAE